MSIKIISNNQVKLSALDAAKYAFHNEGFISAVSAFFKGRKITLEKAITYSKDYNLTRLLNKLTLLKDRSIEIEEEKPNHVMPKVKSKVTLDDMTKAQTTYNNLVIENNNLKKKNTRLKNEISGQPNTNDCNNEYRHKMAINATKQRCDFIRSNLDKINEDIIATEKRITTTMQSK